MTNNSILKFTHNDAVRLKEYLNNEELVRNLKYKSAEGFIQITPKCIPLIIDMFSHDNIDVRATVSTLIGDLGIVALRYLNPVFNKALLQKNVRIVEGVLNTIKFIEMDNNSLSKYFTKVLDSNEKSFIICALKILPYSRKIDDSTIIGILAKLAESEDDEISNEAIYNLVRKKELTDEDARNMLNKEKFGEYLKIKKSIKSL